jgi:hypothetical protein
MNSNFFAQQLTTLWANAFEVFYGSLQEIVRHFKIIDNRLIDNRLALILRHLSFFLLKAKIGF